jgi:glycosyltransferase involved in cell wall biosynthesis
MTPTFSVVTICRNERTRIEKTIQSVLSQTHPGVEYVVIDGASVDGTLDIVQTYRANLTYFASEPDRGIYNAMNKGAAVASGDYLLFMNSGDHFASDDVLQRVSDAGLGDDVIFGYVMNPEGIPKKRLGPARFEPLAYLASSTLPHQATFMRRQLFDELGGFNESYRIVADYELLVRAARLRRSSFRYLPLCISIYDETGVSATAIDAWRSEKKDVQRIWFPQCRPDTPKRPPGVLAALKSRARAIRTLLQR